MKEIPSSWAQATLGGLTEYVTSGSRDWSKYYAEAGALFVRTQDINTNKLAEPSSIAKVCLPASVEGKRTLIRKGDLLITITGANVGRCAHVLAELPEAYVSQSVALVRLIEPSLGRFVHLQLLAPSDNSGKTSLEARAYGMGRPVLNLNNVRETPLLIPPKEEQKRIADKLDTVLTRVDAVNTRLARVAPILKRFRQSVLAAATSGRLTEDWREGTPTDWETVRAETACEKVQSGGTPKAGFATEGVPFLKVYNIVNQQIDFDYKPQYVAAAIHNSELRKSQVQPGDVLMNIVGPPLGKVAIVPSGYPEWNINQAITLFRPSDRISAQWIYIVLCEGAPIREILNSTKGSVGQVNISLSQCRAFEFPVPSPAEQTEIVRRVETLFAFADRLEARLQAAQNAADRLTPSLLAKAFRGELVPQDPTDEPASELLKRLTISDSKPVKRRGRSKVSL